MPPNSIAKTSLIVGGLTFLGFLAGGRLGSMFGAVIGTVVCSMLNAEEQVGFQEFRDDTHHRPNNTNQKDKVKKSKNRYELSECAICLEPFNPSIILEPCRHMCFCVDCYNKAKNENVQNCPICREIITRVGILRRP